jgi:transposase
MPTESSTASSNPLPTASVPQSQTQAPQSPQGPFIGIDISKDRLDLAVDAQRDVRGFSNDARGIAEILALLSQLRPQLVVLEATGGYERQLLNAGLDGGLPFARVEPGRVRHFALAHGLLAKTDHIDARALASFARLLSPPVTRRRSANREELNSLLVYRRQLIDTRTAHSNQAGHAENIESAFVRRSLQRVLRKLENEIDAVDQRIAKFIDSDEELKGLRDVLGSTPGVGPTTAATLISQLPEIGSIDRSQVSALAGVAPFNHDSGRHSGKRAIRGGRRQVRNVLYMATLTAMRCNPVIKAFAQRLKGTGKAAKVVIVACMRKLLTILNAMARDQKPWSVPGKAAPAAPA